MEKEKWALISVYNKGGIVDFAKRLVAKNWKIIASGGTAKKLLEAGITVRDVAELVGGGAILKHRVVTLSREIHAGLLADLNDPEQVKEMQELKLPIIEMVVCDFYPLSEAIAKSDATIESVIELTDIGGPTMVRSAAKGGRIVICNFEDREIVLKEIEEKNEVSIETKQRLRAVSEATVANYCLESAKFHSKNSFSGRIGKLIIVPKYGENAYQSPAGVYSSENNDLLAIDKFRVVAGTEPSYNNICDIDRLLQTLSHIDNAFQKNFSEKTKICVGVKHGNPCGAAVSNSGEDAAKKMALGDTRAIFGGLVMCNFDIDEKIAETLVSAGQKEGFTQKFDGIIAPSFSEEAIETLSRKKGKCRLIENPALAEKLSLDESDRIRNVRGGFLLQPNYNFVLDLKDKEIITIGKKIEGIEKDLLLAWAIGCTSNSNTITIVKDGMLIGNGTGQQDRVGAAELAIKRAIDSGHKEKISGSAAYSDSFFPFPDAPEVLIKAGVKAIFSTSGSINDKLTQDLCEKNNVVLYQLPDAKARGFSWH